jgi:hypothetical protein
MAMKPVDVNAFDILGDQIAASKLAFGAACAYAAAGTIQGTIDIAVSQNLIGIAVDDSVEKDEDGFYSQYDVVPLVTAGRCRVWVTANHTSAVTIGAGDYLEVADIGGTNTLPLGVLQEMGGEGGSGTGAVREATSIARTLEDITLKKLEIAGADLAVGGTTVTMDAAKMTALALAVGDYVLLEDVTANCMINRVKTVTSTTFTLQLASTVALTASDNDVVHKLGQVEAMLL